MLRPLPGQIRGPQAWLAGTEHSLNLALMQQVEPLFLRYLALKKKVELPRQVPSFELNIHYSLFTLSWFLRNL
jgi:hypothetical protein